MYALATSKLIFHSQILVVIIYRIPVSYENFKRSSWSESLSKILWLRSGNGGWSGISPVLFRRGSSLNWSETGTTPAAGSITWNNNCVWSLPLQSAWYLVIRQKHFTGRGKRTKEFSQGVCMKKHSHLLTVITWVFTASWNCKSKSIHLGAIHYGEAPSKGKHGWWLFIPSIPIYFILFRLFQTSLMVTYLILMRKLNASFVCER